MAHMLWRQDVLNPEYGQGAFWRRIRLTNLHGQVLAALEDNSHAMRCRLDHDGGQIKSVYAEMIRVPMNICSGAQAKLDDLIGRPVDTPFRSFYGDGKPRFQCSHLYDLAWLAISHVRRGTRTRTYDVMVPDTVEGRTAIRIDTDGSETRIWHIKDDQVSDAGPLAGTSMRGGFIRRLLDDLSGEDFEEALLLYKAYVVARGRRKLLDENTPLPVTDLPRRNACYAFGDERVADARRTLSRRKITGPEEFQIFSLPWP